MTVDAAQLFLITPPFTGAPDEAARLGEALAGGPVACVLLRHGARDERSAKAVLKPLARLVQEAGAAVLVDGDPRLAAHLDADGVHVAGLGEAFEDALTRMKPDRIVGVGALDSRDDAMTAGEADLDYLLFGEPRPDGALPDPASTLERVTWWAEIFNVPCVGFAQNLAEVGPLAQAGADFVALGDAAFADPRGAGSAVAQATQALAEAARTRGTAAP